MRVSFTSGLSHRESQGEIDNNRYPATHLAVNLTMMVVLNGFYINWVGNRTFCDTQCDIWCDIFLPEALRNPVITGHFQNLGALYPHRKA